VAEAREFPSIVEAITSASRRIARRAQPLDRALEYGELIATLQDRVAALAAERDAAIVEILTGPGRLSHRQLAARLGVSAQRVDQLARIAREGGRPRQPE
jgi:hypothetical protein